MIDRDRLEELRQEIGEEDFSEVADSLATLCAATGPLGPDVFHGLRGSALNLGFTDFATACTEAEKRANAGQSVDVAHLDRLYRDSVKAFETDLSADAA